MKNLSLLLSIAITFVIQIEMLAQSPTPRKTYISPEISIGYTIGGKLNMGFGVDYGVVDAANENRSYGASIDYHIINVKKSFHKQLSFSFMAQDPMFELKLGLGSVRNPWGYGNRNRCIIFGVSSDISFKYPDALGTKIGYRNFLYNKWNWKWFDKHYHSLYLGYQYNQPIRS